MGCVLAACLRKGGSLGSLQSCANKKIFEHVTGQAPVSLATAGWPRGLLWVVILAVVA